MSREVYTASNEHDARDIVERLAERGIRSFVRGEPMRILGIEIPIGQVFPTVCVRAAADLERAREAVDAILAERGERPVEPRWTCACGETLDGQFTKCWSCGEARPDSADPDSREI